MPNTSIRSRQDEDGNIVYEGVDESPADSVELKERIVREAMRDAAEVHVAAQMGRLERILLGIVIAVAAPHVLGAIPALIPDGLKGNEFLSNLRDQWTRAQPTISAMQERLEDEQNRIKGIIDTKAVQTSLRIARTAHTVGMAFSETYRDKVESMYQETANVSRKVFGNTVQISSALNLLRMAVADTTAIAGNEVDLGDAQWFEQSIQTLEMVERNSARYGRNPAAFWYDFNAKFLNPELANRRREQDRQRGNMDIIADGVRVADGAVKALSNSFYNYRRELAPFLSPQSIRELDGIRRDFDSQIRFPIAELERFTTEQWPVIEERVAVLKDTVNANVEGLQIVTELTEDPESLQEPAQARQVTRFGRILGQGLPADGSDASLRAVHDDVEAIKRELPES